MVEIAEIIAGRIFRPIGVDVHWRRGIVHCPKTPIGSIVVSFPEVAPSQLEPSVLASAFPFEGVHLEIYYWRIPNRGQTYQAVLMGHLLVHEITHLLEGSAGHSASGIMKAQWSAQDIEEMLNNQVHFSGPDVARIMNGLLSRPVRLAAIESDIASGRLLAAVR